MTLFGVPEATHFVAGFGSSAAVPSGSFKAYTQRQGLRVGTSVIEGTQEFANLRDASLRESERLLFLGISQYRRSFDLMVPSASSWAHVTIYYGVFFVAASLLGMFGVWKLNTDRIIDVRVGTPGQQELVFDRFSSSFTGSHRAFWDLFYTNVSSLFYSVDPALRFALQPISNNRAWHIQTRNEINYDSFEACRLIGNFQSSFRKSNLRSTLPGTLNTQFRVLEALLGIAVPFAQQFGLQTDALDHVEPSRSRSSKVRNLIMEVNNPSLNRYMKRRLVLR